MVRGSQRASAARNADQVLVVEGTRIVEQGAPGELDRPGTAFRAMLDAE
ncbi:ABC transporter ATP-binding protein [bacterium]|nr:ABC transporter ATP-binding protein [bacterium]